MSFYYLKSYFIYYIIYNTLNSIFLSLYLIQFFFFTISLSLPLPLFLPLPLKQPTTTASLCHQQAHQANPPKPPINPHTHNTQTHKPTIANQLLPHQTHHPPHTTATTRPTTTTTPYHHHHEPTDAQKPTKKLEQNLHNWNLQNLNPKWKTHPKIKTYSKFQPQNRSKPTQNQNPWTINQPIITHAGLERPMTDPWPMEWRHREGVVCVRWLVVTNDSGFGHGGLVMVFMSSMSFRFEEERA